MPPFESTRESSQIHGILHIRAERFETVSENFFGLAALVIACVALVTTSIQLLHQVYVSAEGFRRCHKSVMGLWAGATKRKIRWFQARMEVVFETPVMFTAPPDNLYGPIKERPLYYLNGTEESYQNTLVEAPERQLQVQQETTQRVHTADNERASWLTLLSTLQNAEKFSRTWDKDQRTAADTEIKPPKYGLEAVLQRKTRSWDFVPQSFTRPDATSTICHLVEFMAMLGIYWKNFDTSVWSLRAEGNGFILTTTPLFGLGVTVLFDQTGKSRFEDNRVIPCMGIKDLSFGTVSTIYNDQTYLERHNDAQSLDLVFGADRDVRETLEVLGCSSVMIVEYMEDHSHMFSVSFEIIGMLSLAFRPRGSCFRMLPNPTSDNWRKNAKTKSSWEMTKCMSSFMDHVHDLAMIDTGASVEHILVEAVALAELLDKEDSQLTLGLRETIHDVLDRQTHFLLSKPQAGVLQVICDHVTKVISILCDKSSPLNTSLLTANKEETLIHQYFLDVRPYVVRSAELNSTSSEIELKAAAERDAIWHSLMLRMFCWLLLHDFDKADRMIVPSEIRGSRMPIYIG